MKSLFRLFRYLGPYGRSLAFSVVFMLLGAGMALVQPRLVEWTIDVGITGQSSRIIVLGTMALLATTVGGSLLHLAAGILVTYASQGMAHGIRTSVFRAILSLSFANFDRHRTGELIVRNTSDVTTVQMFIHIGSLLLVQSLAMLAGSLILMFRMNPYLARIMVLVFGIAIILFFILAAVIRPLIMRVRKRLDELNNVLQENLAGAKVVRAFARQDYETSRFEKRNQAYLDVALKTGYITAMAFPFLFFLGQIALVAVTYYGGLVVLEQSATTLQDRLTLGQLVAFNEYAMLAMWPIMALGMTLQFMARAAASATRITEILDERPEIAEPDNPQPLPGSRGDIEFRNVSFSFGQGEPAVAGINLRIASGEVVGIIGRTGAGKSTLAALIPRYYDVDHGTVLVAGIEVRKAALSELRRKVVVTLQESILLSGSIRANIEYGVTGNDRESTDLHDARMQRAAALARADEIITARKNGWEEELGEHGAGLSGGQRQRVAIARAIAADPDILILDDVTSALDAATERAIVANLYRELTGKTVIIISQKINTVRQADRIIVMENGRLVDEGRHEELLTSSRVYREIHETQNAELRL